MPADADNWELTTFRFDAESRYNLERILSRHASPEAVELFVRAAEDAISLYRFQTRAPMAARQHAQEQLERVRTLGEKLVRALDRLTVYAAEKLDDGAVATSPSMNWTGGSSLPYPAYMRARIAELAIELAARRGMPAEEAVTRLRGPHHFFTRARGCVEETAVAAARACETLQPDRSGPRTPGPENGLVLDLAGAFETIFERRASPAQEGVFRKTMLSVFQGAGIECEIGEKRLRGILDRWRAARKQR